MNLSSENRGNSNNKNQGKHGEFGNFAKSQGRNASVLNSLIQKIKDIATLPIFFN